MIKKLLIFLLSLSVFALWFGARTSADIPQFKLTLSPIYENETLNPGSHNNGSLQIVNQGSYPILYSVYATPYGITNEDYTPPDFTPLPRKPDISRWFSFDNDVGLLLPEKIQTINYAINVPAGTAGGGYYAAIFVQSKNTQPKKNSNNIVISQRVGELFYITVSGNSIKNGKVASWSASKFQGNQVSASLRLENDGSVHYLANVKAIYKSVFGSNSYSQSLQRFVLPRTIRNIAVIWPHPPSFGLYRVSGTATTYHKQVLKPQYILIMSESIRIKTAIATALVILIILLDVSVGTIITRIKTIGKRIKK